MKARGMEFLKIPKQYYTSLWKSLTRAPIKVKEDIDELEKLNILIDYDDQGYIM